MRVFLANLNGKFWENSNSIMINKPSQKVIKDQSKVLNLLFSELWPKEYGYYVVNSVGVPKKSETSTEEMFFIIQVP